MRRQAEPQSASPAHHDHTMNRHQINFVFILFIVCVTAQYHTYEDEEEEDDREEVTPRVDYSQYFNGVGGSPTPGVTTPEVEDSSGFVQPLDFTGLFVGGQFGLDGIAGGASQQVFQTPGSVSVALPPLSSGGFPLHHAQQPSNISGFVSNAVNFRSLFDTSGSSTEQGFRPQDFLPKETAQQQSKARGNLFTPAFSTLQRDVDHEVNHQKKEESVIEQSNAATRRYPIEDDESEESKDFDQSEYDFDDTPILDPNDRSPQKYLKQPYEEEEDYGNPHTKITNGESPRSSQRIIYYPRHEARPAESKQRKPLPALQEPEHDDDYHSNDYTEDTTPSKQRPPNKTLYPKYPSKSQSSNPSYEPSHINPQSRPHTSSSQLTYPRLKQYLPQYSSAQTKSYPVSSGLRSSYGIPHSRNGPADFRPSPRDPHLIPSNRRSEYPQSKPHGYDGPYPLPQTEFAAVIPRKPNQPTSSASDSNKSCRKIHKKISPNDFARFKREQMTCYVCTNKEKGNTYEECSYESEPKGNSYYKGSAEAYSSDTVLTPKTFHLRERRNVKYSHNEYDIDGGSLGSKVTSKTLIRKVRQYDYSSDPDEQGHGPENYRFSPEHFRNNGQKEQKKRYQRRYDEDSDYYEGEGEDEDEEDIEKEYQPPGASDSDDCERVDKNGLSCMVCVNSKTGGSYEQCSYASEPEANRYEYARESRYGSKKPKGDRHKRYTENVYQKNNLGKSKQPKPNIINQQRKRGEMRKVNENFQDTKLKRKKVARGYSKKPLAYSGSESKRTKVKRIPVKEEEMPGVVGLDPYFYGSPEKYDPKEYNERGKKIKRNKKTQSEDDEVSAASEEEELEDFNPSYEETFFRLFPELEGTDPYTGERLDGKTEEKEAHEEEYNYPIIPYEEVNDEEESESKQENNKVKPGVNYGIPVTGYYFNDDDDSKKDLEKTLDEFTHKNRSECKKVLKNHMTCYQCLDKKGIQHEECMFVAASEPKGKHLAYHEVKEFRVVPKENTNNSDTNNNNTLIKQDRPFSKHPSVEEKLENVNSDQVYENSPKYDVSEIPTEAVKTANRNRMANDNSDRVSVPTEAPIMIVPDNEGQPALAYDIKKITPKTFETVPTTLNDGDAKPTKVLQRRKRKPEDQSDETVVNNSEKEETDKDDGGDELDHKEDLPKTRPNYNSIPPDPEGFDQREGPEGAYSHETEPVFDSVLKMTLPKYMLMKSEHEEVFDEVFRSG